MQFTLRRPCPADASALVDMKAKAWRQTYTGVVRQSVIDALDENRERRLGGMTQLIGADNGPFFMATDEAGRVMGVAACGPGRDENPPPGIELEMIYVLAEAYGSGLGTQLADAVLGNRTAYLWVVEGNGRAEAFYRKIGFLPDGSRKYDDGLDAHEIRMVRDAEWPARG
ncbi:GNAT family N-acetyltransferase [Arthrobacter roseus]|uniref:GNAT family N-acetyltransferase n=1 Tax=Arthrobacter roseus TaxID=136274 RepID=UPI0019653959|nr:GNAT family N-acetyltransferase [Arthrobacter roseus]MBM7847351.1 GNAT superfamily N-acetyltransferase [Arthrobacter roseus]